jgi:hypothetical protein
MTRRRVQIQTEARAVRSLRRGLKRLAVERFTKSRRRLAPQTDSRRLLGTERRRVRLRRRAARPQGGGRLPREREHIVVGDDATDRSQNLLHGGFVGPLVGCRLLVRG